MGKRIKRCFTAFYRGELMRKNIAGQKVGAQLVSASDGAAFTGAVTVYVTIDAATQAIGTVGSGLATHEGNGYHTYNPSQAETNGTLIAFTFVGTGAVPATVQLVVAEEAADTTLSSLTSGPSTGGNWPNESFGRRVLVGSSTQREVAVTGSNHVAADVHEFQPDAIDSDAIATSAVTEIAGGVWSAASSAYSAATGTMGLIMYAFSQMLELVTGVWRWKATALSQAPTGGGNNVVNVLPAVGISAERQSGVVLSPFVGETITQSITLYATDGTTPINLSGKSLEIVFQTRSGTDVAVIANANITVSGTSNNIVTFAYPSAVTTTERTLRVSLRDNAAPRTVYLSGLCKVSIAPSVDA
jgi:hypothetical protein